MEIKREEHCCQSCGRPLPARYEGDCCISCMERQLFEKVRDYIRANDVNEYDVAEHINIPHRKVKGWIKEGRIEYKEQVEKNISAIFCSRCGAKVNFGTLCQKCLKMMNGENREGFAMLTKAEEGKMRFMDNDGTKQKSKK